MKKCIISISLFLVLAISMPLHAKKMRIAIMNFKAKGVSRALSENVSELIRGEMINTGRFTVIERAQMNNILKEQGFQRTGCTDVSCAVEIGKLLSAKKILIGTVMKMGGMIIITARIVDVQSGSGEFSEKQNAKSEKDLYNAVTIFTQKLTDRIEGTTTYYEESYEESYEDTTVQKPLTYDSWHIGHEWCLGMGIYETSDPGIAFTGALNASNSYGNKLFFGGRLGFLLMAGPSYDLDLFTSDSTTSSYDYENGVVYAGDVYGIFAELRVGLDLRFGRGIVGMKLYAGLGLFKGTMEGHLYQGGVTSTFLESTPTGTFQESEMSYTTSYLTFGLEVPIGKGGWFIGPVFEFIILPTPDDTLDFTGTLREEQIDEGALVIFNIGIKHML